MFSNNNQKNYRTDKYGRPTELVAATAVVDKKSGEVLPIYKAYVTVGGQLLKLEISNKKEHSKDGRDQMWVKATKVNPRRNNYGR